MIENNIQLFFFFLYVDSYNWTLLNFSDPVTSLGTMVTGTLSLKKTALQSVSEQRLLKNRKQKKQGYLTCPRTFQFLKKYEFSAISALRLTVYCSFFQDLFH